MYMEELGCYMKKNNLFKRLLPVGALLAFASLANAIVVNPGQSVVLPSVPLPVPAGSTLDANTGVQTVSTTVGGTSLTVTYQEWVYTDSGTGGLDFIIKATNDGSADPGGTTDPASNTVIDTVTGGNFAGDGTVVTNLGYGVSAANLPVIPVSSGPNGASRTADGSVVGFDFSVAGPVMGGQSTDYLIIKTNATNWAPGTVSFQDSVSVSGVGYGVAPEPNMTALLSVLAIGLVGLAYRRKKNAAKNTEV